MRSNRPSVKGIADTVQGDRPDAATASPDEAITRVDRSDGDFVIDATLISELLDVPSAEVPDLMRSRAITSVCETGIDADQGTFRLNLFHRGRHARLRVDAAGCILQRSTIDFGDRLLPRRQKAQAATLIEDCSSAD